jgi:DNA-binding NarL/FixJ family response regulator
MASAAHELHITSHAVHKRLRSLYSRLDVNSAAQAVWALREELATSGRDRR